jgi:hypothetical protein
MVTHPNQAVRVLVVKDILLLTSLRVGLEQPTRDTQVVTV